MVYTRFPKEKIALLLWVFFLSGCQTVKVPNVGEQGYNLVDQERRMFKRSDEMCEIIDKSGSIHQDQSLDYYLNYLANKLVPDDAKQQGLDLTIKVLDDPTLNAFAFPNGRIYINTGILAVMDNEAQLATLLGHEMTHVINRHALKQFRSVTNKTTFLSVINVPVAIAGGQLASVLTQLAVVSSVSGYSQRMEYEADSVGLNILVKNGYDVDEAPKLYEHLKAYIEDEDVKSPFFFSSHPRVKRRIKNYNKLIEGQIDPSAQEGKVNSDEFEKHIDEIILDNVQFCLSRGMYKSAQKNAARYIARNEKEPHGYYFMGELYRQRQDRPKDKKKRDKQEDYQEALTNYNLAIDRDNNFADAYKSLGRVLQKLKKNEEAKEALDRYLKLNPNVEDAGFIKQMIEGMSDAPKEL